MFDLTDNQDTLRKTTLTDMLIQAMTKAIVNGEFQAGEKLPPGPALAKRFGVSLMVVREAISSLRNEGLVETRHGSGAYVASSARARPFRIETAHAPQEATSAEQIFELRSGVEIRAAELAARRGSDAQMAAISAAYDAMRNELAAGGDGVETDMVFHRRIAEAAGNGLFVSFLDFLGANIRDTIKQSRDAAQWAAQQAEVMQEHAALRDAICRRDVAAAREAAYTHMNNCLLRCH
ncbi:FadR/GntR family transcriptional regulator [Herbaspirillum sp. NPDC087042]|uniref:FadR/GntR family transcriptional regulator n=1 Tax=Herbaspirillum sp. NPDC087042 TaxID=3364004 RepID=UPI003824C422